METMTTTQLLTLDRRLGNKLDVVQPASEEARQLIRERRAVRRLLEALHVKGEQN
jgi:hypothetical protein